MAFTIDDLASELGIDAATLKPDARAKWNGYLTEADTKYQQATTAQKDAEAKLKQVIEEQKVIDQNISSFGMTEANVIALRANNAAMEATLKTLKSQGLDVNIPEAPAAPKQDQFDPTKFQQDVNQSLILGFDMNNRYQRLYGTAMPDDLSVLLREATQARQPLQQYVAAKYDFAGREKSQREEAQKKHDDGIRAAAVKEYQEAHPVTQGNPELQRGVSSRHPQLAKPREGADGKTFANLPARQKIAQSVGRTRQALAANQS
jgi:hypothetical protein